MTTRYSQLASCGVGSSCLVSALIVLTDGHWPVPGPLGLASSPTDQAMQCVGLPAVWYAAHENLIIVTERCAAMSGN